MPRRHALPKLKRNAQLKHQRGVLAWLRGPLAALRRVGKNTPLQGSASDIFKRAMTRVDAALRNHDAQIVNSIHDELVVECEVDLADEVKTLVTQSMVAAGQEFLRRVPVEVEAVCADAWVKK